MAELIPTAAGPLTVEERITWERGEEPPEGWRFGHRHYDQGAGTMHELWTAAPQNKAAVSTGVPHKWIACRRVTLRRYVTEWEVV